MANCKYQKKQYKYSNDNGQTWHNVVPEQIKAGDLIEYDSPDCSTIDAIYRWAELDGQYICVDDVKYTKEIRYESYDAGATWYVSYPAVYRAGERVGVDEDFCNDKFEGHYVGINTGHTCPKWYKWNGYKCVYVDPIKIVKCDGNPTLTSADTAYYSYNYYLVSGKIGECVTDIDDRAFQNCVSLTSITISSGVTSIGSYAFSQCTSLPSITIPNSVTIIEQDAFESCTSLTSIAIPDSVTNIGRNAFYNCSGLTSVTIGNSVTDISCFYRCSGLTSVTIPDSVTSIGRNAFTECTSLTSVTIPDSVTSIGDYAFSGCTSLTSLTIPDSVISIGESAFEKSRISSITIPDSVVSIGSYAFQYCYGLSYIINLSTTPQSLGFNPFGSTNDCPIYVPASAVDTFKNASGWSTYADRIVAADEKWTVVTDEYICEGRTKYQATKLEISIDGGTTWIQTSKYGKGDVIETESSDCIANFKLEAYYSSQINLIPCNSSTELTSGETKPSGYDYSAMTSAEIGDCVTSIGNSVFSGCTYLTSVTIPDSVTSIGANAFNNCYRLSSVTIPSSVTSIGEMAFYDCSRITSVTCLATTPPTLGFGAFNGANTKRIIYVPSSSVDAYKTATNWSIYASKIQAIP